MVLPNLSKYQSWFWIFFFAHIFSALTLYSQPFGFLPYKGIKTYKPQQDFICHKRVKETDIFPWQKLKNNYNRFLTIPEVKLHEPNLSISNKFMGINNDFRKRSIDELYSNKDYLTMKPLCLSDYNDPLLPIKRPERFIKPNLWLPQKIVGRQYSAPPKTFSKINPEQFCKNRDFLTFDVNIVPNEKKMMSDRAPLMTFSSINSPGFQFTTNKQTIFQHEIFKKVKAEQNHLWPNDHIFTSSSELPILTNSSLPDLQGNEYLANCIIVPPRIYIKNVKPILDHETNDKNNSNNTYSVEEDFDKIQISINKGSKSSNHFEKCRCEGNNKQPEKLMSFQSNRYKKPIRREKKEFVIRLDKKLLVKRKKGTKKRTQRSRKKQKNSKKNTSKPLDILDEKHKDLNNSEVKRVKRKKDIDDSDYDICNDYNSLHNVQLSNDEDNEDIYDQYFEGTGDQNENMDNKIEEEEYFQNAQPIKEEEKGHKFRNGEYTNSPLSKDVLKTTNNLNDDDMEEVTPEPLEIESKGFGDEDGIEFDSNDDISQINTEESASHYTDISKTFEKSDKITNRKDLRSSNILQNTSEALETDKNEHKHKSQKKTSQQIKKNENIVCYLPPLLREVNNIIKSYHDKSCFPKELFSLKCKSYLDIGSFYNLTVDRRPRLISKKPKELVADAGPGPKEIVPETLNELLLRPMPKSGEHYYAFPSSNIEIPCFSENIKLSPSSADSAKYKWTHSNEKAITEGRMIEDINHRGVLSISDITFWDSDNYTCTTTYNNPDTEETLTSSFTHELSVVVLPKLAHHMLMHYKTGKKCDQEVLEMFELYMPQLLEDNICAVGDRSLCHIETYNPICKSRSAKKVTEASFDKKSIWAIESRQRAKEVDDYIDDSEKAGNMEMSLIYEMNLNPIADYIPQTVNKSRCPPCCQQKVALKLIQILKESFLSALNSPVTTSEGITFKPEMSSHSLKTVIACDGGLHLSEGYCVPCMEGMYSEEGSTRCSHCPPGFYQDKIASKSCEPCPHPFKGGCFDLSHNKSLFLIIFIVTLLTITAFIVCTRQVVHYLKKYHKKALRRQMKYSCPFQFGGIFKKRKCQPKESKTENHQCQEDVITTFGSMHINNNEDEFSEHQRSHILPPPPPPPPPPHDFGFLSFSNKEK